MSQGKLWGTLDPFFEGGHMGRTVANREFLRALLRVDPCDEYHFFVGNRAQQTTLSGHLERVWPEQWARGRFTVATRAQLPSALAANAYHCFHLSDCITSQPHLARMRNALSDRVFPITGVTHSLSYVRYGRELAAHLWPGCTARDCIAATSTTAVEVLRRWFAHLRHGLDLGEITHPGPRLEVVPLGADCKAMRPPDEAARAKARERWKLGRRRMLLVFARLSHQSKMDLLPVLHMARRLLSQGVAADSMRLCFAGAVEEKGNIAHTLLNLGLNMGLDCQVVENPDEAAKADLFRAADVFLSPVDNLQETFGLTVLEAGAFGLPCVVSDFDGYRDLVAHGETGFLTPTLGPEATPDVDLLAPLVFDSHYHTLLAQQTVVDVAAMAGQVRLLLEDDALRRDMGLAARQRVEQRFTWDAMAKRLAGIWDRLWQEPVDEDAVRRAAHPLHVPYGHVFGGYPTRVLEPGCVLRWSASGEAVYRGREFPVMYPQVDQLMESDRLKRLVFFARKPLAASKLMEKIMRSEGVSGDEARFHVLWALKQDLLESVSDDIDDKD